MDGFNVENYLRISLTDVVLVCISTLIIVLVAKKFFWDKLLAFIDARQNMIQENIDSSYQIKKEAENVKEQYEEKMKNAGQEAHSLMESARASANQEKMQIIEEAQNEASRIKKQAKEDIERDKRNAEKEMRQVISDVAIEAAKKLVQKEMEEDIQKQFVDDFIEQAGDKQW